MNLPAKRNGIAKVHCLPFYQLPQQLMVEVIVIKDLLIVVFQVVSAATGFLQQKAHS